MSMDTVIMDALASVNKVNLSSSIIKLKCSECNTPIAEVYSGSLIIRSRHWSKKHITVIPINRLLKFID